MEPIQFSAILTNIFDAFLIVLLILLIIALICGAIYIIQSSYYSLKDRILEDKDPEEYLRRQALKKALEKDEQ